MELKITVIILMLVGGLYSLALSVIKARSANNETPDNLKDVYDNETYEKWKKYSAEHSRLDIISTIIKLVISTVMLITNVYSQFARLFADTELAQTLSVIILETAVGLVVEVVESYISNMVIEQKYGFNRTSKKTFVKDVIFKNIFAFMLSLTIASLIALLYGLLGVWMIPLFALVALGFTLLVSFLYPVLSKVKNKFTPLEDGELKQSLLRLLEKYGYKVKAIMVMDASTRTTKLNAYFTGFGKLKTIVLYDNLIKEMSAGEICAVFAHEMGHGLHKDVLMGQILNVFYLALIGAMAYFAVEIYGFYTQFGFDGVNFGFTYVLLGVGLSVLQPLVGLLTNARSRRAEYRADNQAVIEGYGSDMITALKKLAKSNFSHLAPSKINVLLEYSHPPLSLRVQNVENQMQNLK